MTARQSLQERVARRRTPEANSPARRLPCASGRAAGRGRFRRPAGTVPA